MALGRQGERQTDLMVGWAELPRSPGHAFYDRLQAVLIEAGFDGFAEAQCAPYYASKRGRPSLPPGRYFRMHLVGYFEGIDSERGLEWRCADSLSLARVPAAGHGRAGAGPFLAYVDGHGKQSRSSLHPERRAAQAKRTEGLRRTFEGPSFGRASAEAKADLCRPSPQLLETASSTVGHRRLAWLKGPVRCALMSGLSRGRRRWPPWVCAHVPGTNLSSALEAQPRIRYRLDCLDHSLSHHAVQRFLPDQSDSRPPPSVRRNVTPLLLRWPRHVPSPGRPPCASSTPKRCAPSCSRAPRSPA